MKYYVGGSRVLAKVKWEEVISLGKRIVKHPSSPRGRRCVKLERLTLKIEKRFSGKKGRYSSPCTTRAENYKKETVVMFLKLGSGLGGDLWRSRSF